VYTRGGYRPVLEGGNSEPVAFTPEIFCIRPEFSNAGFKSIALSVLARRWKRLKLSASALELGFHESQNNRVDAAILFVSSEEDYRVDSCNCHGRDSKYRDNDEEAGVVGRQEKDAEYESSQARCRIDINPAVAAQEP
jgi:hypothetical protein